MAGERFCVRNSGMNAVVEAVGDHACEYMTGGRVVILGPTGRNFAAGMSGGIAYVLDEDSDFRTHYNQGTVELEQLEEEEEIREVRAMIERHIHYTGSGLGSELLEHWEETLSKFIKVMPRDYKRMLDAFKSVEEQGLTGDEAALAAFREGVAAV